MLTLAETPTSAKGPLPVLLFLWALLCLGRGEDTQEEIFTRPGSDLLLPIRRHLTLKDGNCDGIDWKYKESSSNNAIKIARHRGCKQNSTNQLFTNTRISENGSLIIEDVTLHNDGRYRVEIHSSTGGHIQTDDYTVHVEVPVSVPVLDVSCLQNGGAEISCRVEEGTNPTISVSVIGGSQKNYSATANNITAIAGSPGPWNITCYAENRVSREKSRAEVTCPVPLSDIAVTSSCLPDVGAMANCSVNGSDPRYSWSLDGRSVSNKSSVTLPPPVSGTLLCDVTNQLNHLSQSVYIFCPVPVSDPVLDVGCLQNGSTKISCRVKKGTNLSMVLTVIEGLEGYNVTSSEKIINVIVSPEPPPDSWNISCLVKNNISESSANIHKSCRGWCLTCFQKSLIGGSVALLVTMPPLFISHWYILRRMNKKS